MAATSLRKLLINYHKLITTKNQLIYYTQKNGMAIYPSFFIKPIHKKDVQDELEKTGELQKLTHVPTKPVENDKTCSQMQDDLVNLFINYVMRDGMKSLARNQVFTAFQNIKRLQLEKYHKCSTDEEKLKIELNPRKIFHEAVINCKPLLKLTPIKRGGVRYQVPVPVSDKMSQFMSMKWLIAAANDKERTTRFHLQLAYELIDASNKTGRVIKRKQDLHKQCEANRAYAHYRWS